MTSDSTNDEAKDEFLNFRKYLKAKLELYTDLQDDLHRTNIEIHKSNQNRLIWIVGISTYFISFNPGITEITPNYLLWVSTMLFAIISYLTSDEIIANNQSIRLTKLVEFKNSISNIDTSSDESLPKIGQILIDVNREKISGLDKLTAWLERLKKISRLSNYLTFGSFLINLFLFVYQIYPKS